MTVRNIFIVIVVVLNSFSLVGQNLKADIKKINENYSSEKSFKLDMTIKLLENNKTTETTSYSHLQNNKSSYFKIADIATVTFDEFALVIDERVNYMFVIESSIPSLTGPYDTLIGYAKSHDFQVLDSGNTNQYTLFFKNQLYEKIEIQFNSVAFTIKNLKLHYPQIGTDTRVIEFLYSDPHILSEDDKEKLNKKNYVVNVDNNIKLSLNYKNYELIDYRSNKSK